MHSRLVISCKQTMNPEQSYLGLQSRLPKFPVTPEQRSHGDPTASKKNSKRRDASSTFLKHHCSNAVESPVDAVRSHRTQNDSAHFELAKKNAVARRSNKSTVGLP